jgi:hypothetical protein
MIHNEPVQFTKCFDSKVYYLGCGLWIIRLEGSGNYILSAGDMKSRLSWNLL